MDPDYELPEIVKQQAKEREEKEKTLIIDKIKTIINTEFKKEFEFREKQLEQIQNNITKAAKTLHLLRYVLVTAFYNRNDLQLQQAEDEINITDSQNRIHPAIKKLLAGNSKSNIDFNRRKSARNSKHLNHLVIQESKDETLKHSIKTEPLESAPVPIAESTSVTNVENIIPVRNRQMIKRRIVVGNISKWMPSESVEDNSTHKWMVYVRGPKENPNINDFVQKVVFYLHPSYQPNDVIKLKNPPFHLSRRGWGEFPLRVQIFFHCSLNKPVDIIHNLKLDRTYTGRQTLGNETIADLTIYDDNMFDNELSLKRGNDEIAVNATPNVEVNSHEITEEATIPKFEACNALLDHTYTINFETNEITQMIKKSIENISLQQKISQESRVLTSNGKWLILKKRKRSPESLLKSEVEKRTKYNCQVEQNLVKEENIIVDDNIYQEEIINKDEYICDKFKIYFPSFKFKSVLYALPYLLKRLPLITPLALNLDYKTFYPYVAKDIEEFSLWPVEKRLSCEWSRAKEVFKILNLTNLCDKEKWKTKKILAYARAHGYTQLVNYNMLKNKNYNEEYLLETPLNENNETQIFNRAILESNVQIDILESNDDTTKKNKKKLNLVNTNLTTACVFVKQAALDMGVLLKPEEIVPGVMYNSAQRVLLEAAMCLAENVIRNARGILAHSNNFIENESVISLEEIKTVLNSHRPEFRKILNFNKETAKY